MNKKSKLKPMLFSNMKEYSGSQFVKDLISGIVVAIIALPLSIALAIASGVDPQRGIYTAVVAGFLISFLGGSRVQIAGPTAAFATIVAGIVAENGFDGLVIATIIAGILLILMGIFRLGSLIKFIPYTITTGFTAGIAVTLLVGQIKDFLGLTYAAETENIETIDKIKNVFTFGNTFNWKACVVGVVSLLILCLWPKLPKIGQKVPASLLAVLAGIGMVQLLGWDNVKLIRNIPEDVNDLIGLPKFAFPVFTFAKVKAVIGNAFTIAILAAIESLLSCVVADGMINSHHRPNQELIAQGVGNVGSALFGGIPATGAIARTAANIKNGGRTPVAGMVHSLTLVLVLLFLMPYAGYIPMPTIAAILFQVAYNMSGWRTFSHLCKTAPKSDILVLVTTFVLTVVFDLVVAIAVGMVLACVLLMKRMADESSVKGWQYFDEETDPDNIELKNVPKHVRVYEISGPMFFGAADLIADNITIKDFTKVLVVRMRSVPALDATAMHTLEQLYNRCKSNGVQLVFSHVNEQPMKTMVKDGFVKLVGEENFCAHIDDALKRAAELGNAKTEIKGVAAN